MSESTPRSRMPIDVEEFERRLRINDDQTRAGDDPLAELARLVSGRPEPKIAPVASPRPDPLAHWDEPVAPSRAPPVEANFDAPVAPASDDVVDNWENDLRNWERELRGLNGGGQAAPVAHADELHSGAANLARADLDAEEDFTAFQDHPVVPGHYDGEAGHEFASDDGDHAEHSAAPA